VLCSASVGILKAENSDDGKPFRGLIAYLTGIYFSVFFMSYTQLSTAERLTLKTVGQLRAAGYQPRSIKRELRDNLIAAIRSKQPIFEGIWGYEHTVIPDLQRAILSQHHINLLGLRGQAKTRIARLMIRLLDDYIPVIAGTELNDDPLAPISRQGLDLLAAHGDDTPIAWWAREERYTEKLATPDVSVADLIGDVDPIKAAALKLPYSDERVIHYGLIPRSHRGIFVINELPDLQPRIQVALFNILQEGDIQIRGFKLRLPLDMQFVFTANPEDYTNRGSIVTPLKDRIDSQIITHYPKSIDISRRITAQEAKVLPEQRQRVLINELMENIVELVAVEARQSEYVDVKSGVSARLTISAYENLISAAERRALIHGQDQTHIRVGDLVGIIPALTGKVELVYEGEQEGPLIVAQNLIGQTLRQLFLDYFPNPEKLKKDKKATNPYQTITQWFGEGNTLDLFHDLSDQEYAAALHKVKGLPELITQYHSKESLPMQLFLMEFALHGLAEHSMLSKGTIDTGLQFKDLLSSMFKLPDFGEDDEEDFDE
jgi:magnesium chelatase subunit I